MKENIKLDLPYVRNQFTALSNELAFFDSAGGSYVAESVIDSACSFMRETPVQPYSRFEQSTQANRQLSRAIEQTAAFINAEPSELIFGPSTTLNMYVLAHALSPLFARGDEIIVTNQDHEANSGVWRKMAEHGVVVREWKIDPSTGELDPTDFENLLTEQSKLVCLPHCSNIVGSINDVASVTRKAHAAGALVCVDGVAFAPHRRIDVKQLDVDFYLFSFYKLFGPHIALMFIRQEHLAQLHNQNHYFLQDDLSKKLNPGGMNYEAVASLQGIYRYFQDLSRHHFGSGRESVGESVERTYPLIARHEQNMAGQLLEYLNSHSRIRLIGLSVPDASRRVPTFSFTVRDRSSQDIVDGIIRHGVGVNNHNFYARRCLEALGIDPRDGVVRASMVHYNSRKEVDRLIAAIDATV